MSEELNPQKAVDLMKSHGWNVLRTIDLPGRRTMKVMSDPDGEEVRVIFRGRDRNTAPSGGYWYGIYIDDLERAELMVFWATRRSLVLAVPTSFLKKLFDPEVAKIDNLDRWHVNIYFNRGGFSELMTVDYGQTISLDDFRIALSSNDPDAGTTNQSNL